MPQGRYAEHTSVDLVSRTTFPETTNLEMTKVSHLLWLELLRRAEEDKGGEALVAARALLQVARSLGDDPGPGAQFTRLSFAGIGCAGIELALARDKAPGEDALAQTQKLVEDESAQLFLFRALAGHRAQMFASGEALQGGDLSMLSRWNAEGEPFALYWPDGFPRVELWLRSGWLLEHRSRRLREMTEKVEIARLPLEQQIARTDPSAHSQGPDSAAFYHCEQTRLRCTAAALAVERFRVLNQRWPAKWEELVPSNLAAVPIDPYDGQPLRMRASDGILIWSIGGDRTAEGSITFRLWDVNRRGEPANSLK
jgi:hypothetical protein